MAGGTENQMAEYFIIIMTAAATICDQTLPHWHLI